MSSKKKRRKKIKQREKKQGTDSRFIRRFILHYFILMAAFVYLKESEFIKNIIDINGLYSESIVLFTSKILGILGVSSTYHGSIIQLYSISLDVKFGCNGLEAVMIYSIGVAAFPGTWKKKLIGIAAGLMILQIINLIRIVSLAWSAIYYKTIFETMHIYVAPGIMIAVALFIFLMYLNLCPEGNLLKYSCTDNVKQRRVYQITSSSLCKKCHHFGVCTTNKRGRKVTQLFNEEIRHQLESEYKQPESQEVYKLRQQKVELPFGHIKRNLKVDAFLLRGREGAKAEMSILASCFNMARMITILGVPLLMEKLTA